MNIKINQLSLLLGLFAMLSFSTLAKDHKQHSRGDDFQKQMRHVMSKLELTTEQQTQIKSIQQSRKEQSQTLKGDFTEYRQSIAQLIKAPEFDEIAFKDIQQKMAVQKIQLSLISAKSMHQIYNVLTAEQKRQFENYRQSKRGKKETQ